ncbi:MAG TPA: fumarylacetoacetate hydrolase family protein [Chitinophagaceae bacterium]|nr:fumarylacetoacetate hydrolase family protein [Chitinophagaceae bacterium]
MRLYKTLKGILLENNSRYFLVPGDWDDLINRDDLFGHLATLSKQSPAVDEEEARDRINTGLLPPIGSQEVWAAGVTYLKSRDARMEESGQAGHADCYQKVYEAPRPELFFKSLAHRVAGPHQEVYIRKDSTWNVPEPELTLFINAAGSVQGYTVGNDMSSRSIEGENPLYLPQAKVYERSASLGPCLYVPDASLPASTVIRMRIRRHGQVVYDDQTPVSRMKRSFRELADYLYRECDFPWGCLLMTGTCLVPPPDFTLRPGDDVEIEITDIGILINRVGLKA